MPQARASAAQVRHCRVAIRRVRAGLVCWPKPGTRYGKRAIIGAARLRVPVAQPLRYLARPCWGILPLACPPTVTAADGHGMILIARRVDLSGRDISCCLSRPGHLTGSGP